MTFYVDFIRNFVDCFFVLRSFVHIRSGEHVFIIYLIIKYESCVCAFGFSQGFSYVVQYFV